MIATRPAAAGVAPYLRVLAVVVTLVCAVPAEALPCRADETRDRIVATLTTLPPRGASGAVHIVVEGRVPNIYVEPGAQFRVTVFDETARTDVTTPPVYAESVGYGAGVRTKFERDVTIPLGHRYSLQVTGATSWMRLYGSIEVPGPVLDRGGIIESRCSVAAAMPMKVKADYMQDGEFRLYSALGSQELSNAPQCASCGRGESSRREITFSAYTGLRIKNYIALGVRDVASPRADKLLVTDSILLSSGPQCANADPFRQIAIEPDGQPGAGSPCSSKD